MFLGIVFHSQEQVSSKALDGDCGFGWSPFCEQILVSGTHIVGYLTEDINSTVPLENFIDQFCRVPQTISNFRKLLNDPQYPSQKLVEQTEWVIHANRNFEGSRQHCINVLVYAGY